MAQKRGRGTRQPRRTRTAHKPSGHPARKGGAHATAPPPTRASSSDLERAAGADLRRPHEHTVQAAFALAAMRSRVTAHVLLRGDAVVASNKLFLDMTRDRGVPWQASDGARWPNLREAVRAQSAATRSSTCSRRYERSDGTRIVEVRTEPFLNPAGRLVLATVLDITAVVHAAAEAGRAEARADALRESIRMKDEFLGMLSHELRNPLAPIMTSIHVLDRAGASSDHVARARAVIKRQVEHLSRLVDEMLDMTRIARGQIELRRSVVDLRVVVQHATDDFRALLDEHGVTLRTAFPEAEVWTEVDTTRVTQILGNLLHNAGKFTRQGDDVTVTLSVDTRSAELRVSDTGVGIDGALLPAIFEAFTQGSRSLARTRGGLGLGLAMVKGLAELHGGSIRAESPGVGQGATFVVRLPLANVDAPPTSAPASGPPPHRRTHVLVVDDNRDAADSLAEVLRLMYGHTVDVAYDGPSALDKAQADPPDVVLCDIGLPGMSGYDVARAFRAGGADRPPRLIALSGYAQPEDVKRAIEAGFDVHVAKPCQPDDLERLLGPSAVA